MRKGLDHIAEPIMILTFLLLKSHKPTMSATVYTRIIAYEQANPNFSFNRSGMRTVGILVKEEWKRQGGRPDQTASIQQVERYGTWSVLEYPQSFVGCIDMIIRNYVQCVVAKGLKKHLNEKPQTLLKQQNQTMSVPNSLPQNLPKRKRLPVQKLAFSGRNFNK